MYLRFCHVFGAFLVSGTITLAISLAPVSSLNNVNSTSPPDLPSTNLSSCVPRLGDPTRPDAAHRQTMPIRPDLFLRFDQSWPGVISEPPFDAWELIALISQLQSFAMQHVLFAAHRAPIRDPRGVRVPEFRFTRERHVQMIFRPSYSASRESEVYSGDMEFMAKQLVRFVTQYQVRDTRIALVEGDSQDPDAAHNRIIGVGILQRRS